MALVAHGQVNLPHAQKSHLCFPACAMSGLSHGSRPRRTALPGDGTAVSSHVVHHRRSQPFSVSLTQFCHHESPKQLRHAPAPGCQGRASRHDLRPSLVTLCRCCHWPTAALTSTLGRSQQSSRTDSPSVLALPSGAWQRARTIGDGTRIVSM